MLVAIILVAKAIIAIVMVLGFVMNCFSKKAVEEFERLGYPSWFRHVTGVLEAIVAVAIFIPDWEIPGLVLGAIIMLAAVISLARFKEWLHGLPAFLIFILSVILIIQLQ
tara:strand:+ start:612 stop:941 length:330 start_codon:yes stop_codon:yes gene_type:complete